MNDALERRLADAWKSIPGPDQDLVEAMLARTAPFGPGVRRHRSPIRVWVPRLVGSALTAAFVAVMVLLLVAGPGHRAHTAGDGATVPVPDLVGRPVREITSALPATGLRWRTEPVSSSQPAGSVLSQDPAAGTAAPSGTTVAIRFAVPEVRTDVPDAALDVAIPRPDLPAGSTLRSLRGNVVVFAFLATWCQPCLRPIPTSHPRTTSVSPIALLGTLDAGYKGRGALFVPVAVNDARDDARALVPANAGLPLVVDPGGELAWDVFKGKAVPAFVVLDREGRVAGQWFGATGSLVDEIDQLVDALTREPVPLDARLPATTLPLAVLSGSALPESEIPAGLLAGEPCVVYPEQVFLLGRSPSGEGFYLARGPRDWTVSTLGGESGCGPARDLATMLAKSPAGLVFGSQGGVGDRWSAAYLVRDGYDTATMAGASMPILNNALILEGAGPHAKELVISGPAGRATIALPR